MRACSFCGEDASHSWAHVAAGPDLGVCDRCIRDVRDAGPGGSPAVCSFCGEVAPVVTGGARPVTMCGECVSLAADAIAGSVDIDDPWYLPLRDDAGGWVHPQASGAAPLASGPDDVAAVRAWAEQRLADLAAMGLPADGDVPAIVRRKAIAARIGERAAASSAPLGLAAARALAERWLVA